MYHSFLIHSSADGHLGCFHVLAIINSLSQHQGLSQCVSSSHQVAKVLEFQHQAPSVLTSFRTDWFDLLAVQGTLKRLLQHYSLKA